VAWRFANAREAACRALGLSDASPPRFDCVWQGPVLHIRSDQTLFGPAPFIAVEEVSSRAFRDNPTQEGPCAWAYSPPRLHRTTRVAVAGANVAGQTAVKMMTCGDGRTL
jgi:hypothetical protein